MIKAASINEDEFFSYVKETGPRGFPKFYNSKTLCDIALFIYLFLAALGLRCCARAFL